MNKFEALVSSGKLYSESFTKTFGINNPHWFPSNWHQRELSLRHDMVCVLLCNLEEVDMNMIDEERTTTSSDNKRKKLKLDEDEKSESDEGSLDYDPMSDSGSEAYIGSVADDEEEDYQNTLNTEWSKRFMLLEGCNIVAQRQNTIAKEWGIQNPDSQWDIIDKQLKKFIEVKVTTSENEALAKYLEKQQSIKGFSSLVIINPISCEIKWVDHPGGVTGESKVVNFLARRGQMLRDLDIPENPLLEMGGLNVDTLLHRVFCCNEFNSLVKEWVSPFWAARFDPPICNNDTSMNVTKFVEPRDLLAVLEDPRERSSDIVKWKGKILPEPMVDNIIMEVATDSEMISMFFGKFEIDPNCMENRIINAIRIVKDEWENGEGHTNYRLVSQRKLSKDPKYKDLSFSLGVLAKKGYRDDGREDTTQPEYSEPTKMRYHPWFDSIVDDMAKFHMKEYVPFGNLEREESEIANPMGVVSSEVCTHLVKLFNKTFAAITSSKNANTYSRLGGSYLIGAGRKSSHTYAAIMPIYATCRDSSGGVHRYCHGILVRAPQHARSSTDRINFITIEKISNTPRGREYAKYIHKAHFFQSGTSLYCVRQNSIKKIDPGYAMFSANSLFVTANLVGELIINNKDVKSNSNIIMESIGFISLHSKWLADRMAEGVIVGMIANTNDEGMFGQIRKSFMMCMNWKRGSKSICWDIESFGRKCNECLLDNCLAMHYQCSLIDILRSWDDERKVFSARR